MTAKNKHPKFGKGPIAIALQGSFGHKYYALGIMCGLEEALNESKMRFAAGSGCVEMLLPLWLYFQKNDQRKVAIRDYFSKILDAGPSLIPAIIPGYDLASLLNYGKSVFNPQQLSLRHALANCWGPPGGLTFNQYYFNGAVGEEFERLMNSVDAPVFTNALNARNFQEIYLYSGTLPGEKHQKILGKKGRDNRRHLIKLSLQEFIASGSRPPFFAPMRVQCNGTVQCWMEGAMRCNPPLNPLIDVGASQILLIRFFAKETTEPEVDNEPELFNRYLDSIFTAPLEKELELIEMVNGFIAKSGPDGKRPVEVLDAIEDVKDFQRLVQDELDCFSHFQFADLKWESMFERGVTAGRAIASYYS
jgi:predicted acylesterase/phospholipase RssA